MATYVIRFDVARFSSVQAVDPMQTASTVRTDNQRELRLLRRVVDRDRDAIAELYRIYHPRLFKFIFRLTSSYTAAEELVNDVMLLVWRKASSFRGESKVSTWIFGIAYRQTMRRVTRKKLRLAPAIDMNNHGVDEDSALETENWVRKGLLELSSAQQLTVMLVFYLGLSYEEIADITQCPVNTVKTRMYHARRKLKKLLASSALPNTRGTHPDE
jgi:RNA polymerase sigma-70 factor, ECF subfamily